MSQLRSLITELEAVDPARLPIDQLAYEIGEPDHTR